MWYLLTVRSIWKAKLNIYFDDSQKSEMDRFITHNYSKVLSNKEIKWKEDKRKQKIDMNFVCRDVFTRVQS